MKNLILVLTFISSVTLSTAQWNINAYRSDKVDVEIIDKDTLILIGAKGQITRTTNGGNNWSTQVPFSSFRYSWFSDIHFPTKNVGYISGGSWFGLTNILIKTMDGGQTWDSLSSGTGAGNFIDKIHFIDKDTGFMIMDNRSILKTLDGGITRSVLSSLTLSTYSDFTFTDNNVGFFTTREAISSTEYIYSILKTTDFAQTFTPVYIDTMTGVSGFNNRIISNIQFIDNINGFAVGGNGMFLKTTDGGNTWSRSLLSPFNQLTSVHFVNPSLGYINNAGGIYKTIDGGNSWNVQQVNPVSTINRINFLNDTIGYALSNNAVYKTNNGGKLVGLNLNRPVYKLKIYPNPASSYIKIESEKIKEISILSIDGKLMLNQTSTSPNQIRIELPYLPKGIYLLKVLHEDNSTQYQKIGLHL